MKHFKRIISLLIVSVLLLSMLDILPAVAKNIDLAESIELQEGTYEKGEVVVMFKEGSLKMKSTRKSLEAVREKEDVSEDFGSSMEATDSENAAVATVTSQEEILSQSLGKDFVIEDTVLFSDGSSKSSDDGPDISLISSEKYSTEEMIALLSSNEAVAAVEPNYYTEVSSTDYSLDDEYASYSYQLYGQDSKNTDSEKPANTRGFKEDQISLNAPTGWKAFENAGNDQNPVVVALLDTGINADHEDLSEVLWHNPGNIGLSGDYGYDFVTNSDRPTDYDGHGTHCAGIIAAQANNGIGVAGVAGNADVQIMMLKIIGSAGKDPDGNPIESSTVFGSIGALAYIKKAKERGVNVVAVNNSWGITGGLTSGMLDSYYTALGELGILNIIASGNDNLDNDLNSFVPTNTTNDYTVTVNSSNEDGKKAKYSCYGKASTDLFAPGSSILSTVSYKNYLPCIQSADRLPEDTVVYGEFSADSKPDQDGKIEPVSGDDGAEPYEGVGTFGAAEIVVPDCITSSVEISTDHCFNTSKNPASLKWTISGLTQVEDWFENEPIFYLYFPYEKAAEMTKDNTLGSIVCKVVLEDGDEIFANLSAGDICIDDDGQANLAGWIDTGDVLGKSSEVEDHLYGKGFASNEEVDGKTYGFGLRFMLNSYDYDVDTVSIYIDSLAISRTFEDEFDAPGDYYDIMSGTSMATPNVTGAAALIAATEPGISALDLKNRLFSMVTKTDDLADLCSTGGYLDFDNYSENLPAVREAVADTSDLSDIKIALLGDHFTNENNAGKLTVSWINDEERLIEIGQDASDSEPYAVWQEDTITIHNAGELVGCYLSFEVTNSDGALATGRFFVTKGEGSYTQVIEPTGVDDELFARLTLFSDGEDLYASNPYGDFYKLNGDHFDEMDVSMVSAMLKSDFYNKELGLSPFDLSNGKPSFDFLIEPIFCDGYVYEWFTLRVGSSKFNVVLASCDITSASPQWEFSLCDTGEAYLVENYVRDISCYGKAAYNGKIYFISGNCDYVEENTAENELTRAVYSFDPATRTITQEPQMLPYDKGYRYMSFIEWNGCLYGFMGLGEPLDDMSTDYGLSNDIIRFDGNEWTTLAVQTPPVFRTFSLEKLKRNKRVIPALGATKDGILIAGVSADGYGDTMLFDGETFTPVYYSIYDGISDATLRSGVATNKGFYVTTFLDIDGTLAYDLLFLPKSAYEGTVLGDVDGDGEVTVIDATAIQRKLAGLDVDNYNEAAADADGDGKVTIVDATEIQRWLAGLQANENIGKVK